MAGKIKDITGQRFGRLVALERLNEKHNKHGYMWKCKCDCGNNEVTTYLSYLTSGHTTSCGCLRDDVNSTPNSYEDVIKRVIKKHNSKYEYPEYNKDNYENQLSRIDIICPIHGMFNRTIHNHLRGSGCTECRNLELIEDRVFIGGYTHELFYNNSDLVDSIGCIYYLKIEEYYKIGITRAGVKNRVSSIKHRSKKDVEIIDFIEMNLYDCFILEQLILDIFKDNRIYRKWSTELFNKDILNGKIPRME